MIAPSADFARGTRCASTRGSADCDGARRSLVRLGRLLAQVGSVEDALDYLEARRNARLSEPARAHRTRRRGHARGRTRPNEEPVGRRRRRARCAPRRSIPATLSEDGKFAVFLALLSLNDALLLERENDAGEPVPATRRRPMPRRRAIACGSRTRRAQRELRRGELEAGRRVVRARARHRREGGSVLDAAVREPRVPRRRGVRAAGRRRRAVRSQFARRALETSAARGEVSQMVAALQLLAGALRESKDRAGAARTLEVAVRLIEQVPIDELDGEKRATYLATQHAVFSELTELLITDAQDEGGGLECVPRSEARARAQPAFRDEPGGARERRARGGGRPPSAMRSWCARSRERRGGRRAKASCRPTSSSSAKLVGSRSAPHAAARPNRQVLLEQLARLDASLVEYAVGRRRRCSPSS